jgi:hypothetical protein
MTIRWTDEADGWQSHDYRDGFTEYRIAACDARTRYRKRYAVVTLRYSDGAVYGTTIHGYSRQYADLAAAKQRVDPRNDIPQS